MEPFEALKKEMEYNASNERFAPLDDDDLGTRISGGFCKLVDRNGRLYKRFVFDNGAQFSLDIEDRMLYPLKSIPDDYFMHKYLERIVHDLKQKYQSFLEQEDGDKFFCSSAEIWLQSSIVVRLLPYRNERTVYLTNIQLPPQLRGQGVGLQLISKVYSICKKFDYRLLIVGMVETFYNRMVQRGATIIEENDVVEVTDKTNLGQR